MKNREAKAFNHYRKRLSERYGIENLHLGEFRDLRSQISNGHKNHFVGRVSESKTWWIVDIQDQKVLSLYCIKSHAFLTCMPLAFLESALKGKPRKLRYLGLSEVTTGLERIAKVCGISPKLVDADGTGVTVPLTL